MGRAAGRGQKDAGFLVSVRRVIPMQVLIRLVFSRVACHFRSLTSSSSKGDDGQLRAAGVSTDVKARGRMIVSFVYYF